MKRLLADVNIEGLIDRLARRMQSEYWVGLWKDLEIVLVHFADVGLNAVSADSAIWALCQTDELLLITDNRNADSPDSLEATIRRCNTADSLPVFTISDIDKLRTNRGYVQAVIESLYDYLLRIDSLRGTGRLYLPLTRSR